MDSSWLVLILLYGGAFLISVIPKVIEVIRSSKINNSSYKNFAEFYGETTTNDVEFKNKINKICSLIKDGERDIKKIAEASSCTEEECVFKIKYLKSNKMIQDFDIDTFKMMLLNISDEEERLLKKYNSLLYGTHPQIDVMANVLAKKENKSVEEEKEIIFKELKYLDDRNLLNGIKVNEVDKKLIYYTVDKRETSNLKTVHCPNCGALNEIDEYSKIRCTYCDTIIIGDKYHD